MEVSDSRREIRVIEHYILFTKGSNSNCFINIRKNENRAHFYICPSEGGSGKAVGMEDGRRGDGWRGKGASDDRALPHHARSRTCHTTRALEPAFLKGVR